MKVGHFSDRGTGFVGAVFGNRVFNLTLSASRGGQSAFADITSLLKEERFDGSLFTELYRLDKDRHECWHELEHLSFLPLFRPGKVICLGLNYSEHARETNTPLPEEPIYFEKAATAVIAHDQAVMCPSQLGRIDHEVELAVIMGKRTRGVKEAEAGSCIAGYTILNDVTARDVQAKDVANRHPWYRSKSYDTFCPIGPWIVTCDEINPVESLKLQLRVNGQVRQHSSTQYLIFTIPALIERISSLITLESGDIISTGTPDGISPIYPGDIMEAEIEKIGILRNQVKQC